MASLSLSHLSSLSYKRYAFNTSIYFKSLFFKTSRPRTIAFSKEPFIISYENPLFQTRFHARSSSTSEHPGRQLENEVAHEFRFFRVYKDGRVEKFRSTEKIPPSDDPATGVRVKDVAISTEPAVSARIFLPKIHDPTRKLPVLYHVHGGGFCFESAFSPLHAMYLTSLTAKAQVITVSVEYGLFPDRPIPACYEESWAGLRWVAGHAGGNGPEPWLNDHADFGRVFIGGESAGGNISHTLALWVGETGLPGIKVRGLVLVHPYFGGTDDDQMWLYMYPTNGGLQDPKLNPAAKDMTRLGCERVLIFVAEKDHLSPAAKNYYKKLKGSGWNGTVEIVENEGEDHCFHMENLINDNALALIQRFVSFIKDE